MNYKKFLVGSILSMIVATSSFWLPALLFSLGASERLLNLSLKLAKISAAFMIIGIGLFILSIYHYQLAKKS